MANIKTIDGAHKDGLLRRVNIKKYKNLRAILECFPNVKQAFLLYQVGSLVILIAY